MLTTSGPLQPVKVVFLFFSESCASLGDPGFLLVTAELLVSMVVPTSSESVEVCTVRLGRIRESICPGLEISSFSFPDLLPLALQVGSWSTWQVPI